MLAQLSALNPFGSINFFNSTPQQSPKCESNIASIAREVLSPKAQKELDTRCLTIKTANQESVRNQLVLIVARINSISGALESTNHSHQDLGASKGIEFVRGLNSQATTTAQVSAITEAYKQRIKALEIEITECQQEERELEAACAQITKREKQGRGFLNTLNNQIPKPVNLEEASVITKAWNFVAPAQELATVESIGIFQQAKILQDLDKLLEGCVMLKETLYLEEACRADTGQMHYKPICEKKDQDKAISSYHMRNEEFNSLLKMRNVLLIEKDKRLAEIKTTLTDPQIKQNLNQDDITMLLREQSAINKKFTQIDHRLNNEIKPILDARQKLHSSASEGVEGEEKRSRIQDLIIEKLKALTAFREKIGTDETKSLHLQHKPQYYDQSQKEFNEICENLQSLIATKKERVSQLQKQVKENESFIRVMKSYGNDIESALKNINSLIEDRRKTWGITDAMLNQELNLSEAAAKEAVPAAAEAAEAEGSAPVDPARHRVVASDQVAAAIQGLAEKAKEQARSNQPPKVAMQDGGPDL